MPVTPETWLDILTHKQFPDEVPELAERASLREISHMPPGRSYRPRFKTVRRSSARCTESPNAEDRYSPQPLRY